MQCLACWLAEVQLRLGLSGNKGMLHKLSVNAASEAVEIFVEKSTFCNVRLKPWAFCRGSKRPPAAGCKQHAAWRIQEPPSLQPDAAPFPPPHLWRWGKAPSPTAFPTGHTAVQTALPKSAAPAACPTVSNPRWHAAFILSLGSAPDEPVFPAGHAAAKAASRAPSRAPSKAASCSGPA